MGLKRLRYLFKLQFLKQVFLVVIFGVVSIYASAQSDFYNMFEVREIKIYFADSNWKYRLDSLFEAGDSYSRINADVEIDGNLYKECGIRYKGFSSWNADEIKNPFSINLDYTFPNQNHLGFKKLKLSNVIYDPSFVREVLSYSIARKYMPASEANFANLFINDTLIGLYSNVEAVDECFAAKHFLENDNPFFKGNPETLVYPFGQNSNLGYTHGDDSTGYMPFYSLESEYGWEELFNFIDVLNNDTANISQVLNIDRALWMHALNYALLNLDSYIAYAQNYYLYQDENLQFNTIPWDFNMSFGSFRHSDGATNFSGVTMAKLPLLNPLQALTFTISPRPLMKNLLQNATYKKMYLAHLRTIVTQNIDNGEYLENGEILQGIIDYYVTADTNKFYSYQDFTQNLYTLTGTSTEQYPGIQDIMESRSEYLSTFTGISGYPIIGSVEFSNTPAIKGEELGVSVNVSGAVKLMLFYRCSSTDVFSSVQMFDDGLLGDETAGDSVFYAKIIPDGKVLQYYLWAENDSAGAFLPESAAYEFYTHPIRIESGDIVLNEMIYNNYNFGDVANFSDIEGLEIYNPYSDDLLLNNLKISYKGLEFAICDTLLCGKQLLMIYPEQYSMQTSFISSDSYLKLVSDSEICIDSTSPELCSDNRSIGRFPDGALSESVLIPTPGSYNKQPENFNNSLSVFPSPAIDKIYCELKTENNILSIQIFNSSGELVYSDSLDNKHYIAMSVDISSWVSSVYLVKVCGTNLVYSAKFLKL